MGPRVGQFHFCVGGFELFVIPKACGAIPILALIGRSRCTVSAGSAFDYLDGALVAWLEFVRAVVLFVHLISRVIRDVFGLPIVCTFLLCHCSLGVGPNRLVKMVESLAQFDQVLLRRFVK